jgi:membrane-associated phospholipid phosphatase
MKFWNSYSLSSKTYVVFFLFLWLILLNLTLLFPKFEIHQWLNGFHNFLLDSFFSWITLIGDGVFAVLISLLFFIYDKKKGLFILSTFLISSLLAQLLKNFVFDDFMRPFYYIQSGSIQVPTIEGVKMHSSNSFPSGHTTTIFALTTMISFFYQSKKTGFFLLLIAVLVGYSRIYLSQHFLEDTLAGSIIGLVTSAIIFESFQKKYPIK